MNFNIWKIATGILILVVIVLAVIMIRGNINNIKPTVAVQKAVDFINSRLGATGEKATLTSIDKGEIKLYKFTIDLSGKKYVSYVSSDGRIIFPYEGTNMDAVFSEKVGVDVCKENDKPIIYFFGSEKCPHCQWEKPIMESVVKTFGDTISFHENIDSTNDQDVFSKYSDGVIPTIVVGCKYYRIGSGESIGEEQEKSELTRTICAVTNNLPASVCQ